MSINPKYLARFSVVLNEAQSVPVAVAYATEDGTALQDVDYEHDAGELVFQPGETELYVSVPTRDFDASATSFKLQLTSPVNATVVRATGVALFPTGAGRQIVFRDTFDTPSESIDNRIPEVGKGYTPESIAVVEDGVAKAYHPDGYSSSLALVGMFRGASREDGSISLKFTLSDYRSTPSTLLEDTTIELSEAMHEHYFRISFNPASGSVLFEPSNNDFENRTIFLNAVDGTQIDVEMRWNFEDGVVGLYLNGAWAHSFQYAPPLDCFDDFTIFTTSNAAVDNVEVSLSGDVSPPDVWELVVPSPLFWYARGADGADNATPTLETGAEESTYWNSHVAYGRLRATATGDITWRTEWAPAVVGAQAPTSHWPTAPYTVNGADNTANFTRTIKAGFPTWERDSIGEFRAYCSVDGVEIPGYLWLTWLPPVQGSTYNQHAWGYSDEIGEPPEGGQATEWTDITPSAGSDYWRGVGISDNGRTIATVGNGTVDTMAVSTDGGSTWNTASGYPAEHHSLMVTGDGSSVAAGSYYVLFKSTDSGVSWQSLVAPQGVVCYAATSDGSRYVNASPGGNQTSSDAVTWTNIPAMSNSRTLKYFGAANTLYGMTANGTLRKSSDHGATAITAGTVPGALVGAQDTTPLSLTCSSDGTRVAFVSKGLGIYISDDSGANWRQIPDPGSSKWFGVGMSGDGRTMVAVSGGYDKYVKLSFDGGFTWETQTGLPTTQQWDAAAISKDGKTIVITGYNAGCVWRKTLA